ncbi:MAG TPA: hypothetical protein VGR78_03420 [Verrucomicrobiae bacterium]|nr:hypothetical protein [Verrucomicrobiae bacterium]
MTFLSTKGDTVRLLELALSWIDRHLQDFDPFRDGRAFEMVNGQRVGELALLLQTYVMLTGDRQSRRIRRMSALLKSIQHNHEFSDRPLRSQIDFVLAVLVYSALRAVGAENAQQREVLERLLRLNLVMHTERLPYRLMEVVFCTEWAGLRHSLPTMNSLYRRSILAGVPCPIYLHDDDIYSVTHVLMYFFAMGTRSGVALPSHDSRRLNEVLSALIVVACQDHHWDLLAELLLCWDCLGNEASIIYERGWKELMKIQQRNGALPGPEWAQRIHAATQSKAAAPDPDFLRFTHYYHTTLVSCISALVRLRRFT